MSRSRFDLCDGSKHRHGVNFVQLQAELTANCATSKVFIYTIDTLRTLQEQQRNMDRGFSKTLNSLHLPQIECGLAHAFDVVPVIGVDDRKIKELEWDSVRSDGSPEPEWEVIAQEANKLGLRAGFTSSSGKRWDLGHIQRPGETARVSVSLA